MSEKVQLVVLGMGDSALCEPVQLGRAASIAGQVAARFAMDHELAHQIYAGC